MSGHVFHAGHHALHGVTVFVRAAGGRAYIGRFDSEDEAGVHLLDVSVHGEADAAVPLDDFLRRTIKFGVRVDQKHVLLASGDVERIAPLNDIAADG